MGVSPINGTKMMKSVGGAYIHNLDVSTSTLPGNFGARVMEVYPTDLTHVWRERKTVVTALGG